MSGRATLEPAGSDLHTAVATSAWRCSGLVYRYQTGTLALAGVSLEVPAGACTALLGPNGSGKSTLLRVLLGSLRAGEGSVEFQGRPLQRWARRALAREIGVVPQAEEEPFPLTVREMVAMGRYPHLGPWRREREADRRAIDAAMARCDVASVAERLISTLSGGERQRVRIARALAQEPGTLALDEPTTSLDVRHEMAIFELLRTLGGAGVTVLLATHNLNLAARYAERLVLLDGGRVAAQGTPREVLSRERLEQVYDWPVRIVPHPGPGSDAGVPQVVPLAANATAERGNDR